MRGITCGAGVLCEGKRIVGRYSRNFVKSGKKEVVNSCKVGDNMGLGGSEAFGVINYRSNVQDALFA